MFARLSRKEIIDTLRLCRVGARRITVLAAVVPGLVFFEARNELICSYGAHARYEHQVGRTVNQKAHLPSRAGNIAQLPGPAMPIKSLTELK